MDVRVICIFPYIIKVLDLYVSSFLGVGCDPIF